MSRQATAASEHEGNGNWMVLASTGLTLAASMAWYGVHRYHKSKAQAELQRQEQLTALLKLSASQKSNRKESYSSSQTQVYVFFGSQTGTAEGMAETLVDEGRERQLVCKMVDLEDFKPSMLLAPNSVSIFLLATYGEGEPTDNAVDFMAWMKGKGDVDLLEDDQWSSVKFSVFGLGNRQYEQYNFMGRWLDKKLEKAGAVRSYNYGEGDDDGTLEEDFEEWKEELWPAVKLAVGSENDDDDDNGASNKTHAPRVTFECKFIKAVQEDASNEADKGLQTSILSSFTDDRLQHSNRHFFTAVRSKVVAYRELRNSTEDGSTLHMEYDIKNIPVNYVTADNLSVLPENEVQVVTDLAAHMGYNLSQWFELKAADEAFEENEFIEPRHPFPTPCTVRYALTNFVDLGHAPRRHLLHSLAHFASNETEQDRLLFLSSKDGMKEYHRYVVDGMLNIVDILEEFPSIKVPLDAMLHMLPSLHPRYYTISSSSVVNPNRIHATVSVIKEPKKNTTASEEFRGICSNYMASLNPADRQARKSAKKSSGSEKWPSSRIYIRPSSFRLPADASRPILLIGPGTGIAPMRAFLQERESQRNSDVQVGKTVLYFGCRYSTKDYIYQDELEVYQASGTLTQLNLAFSRDQPSKVYVQHLMADQGAEIWDLVEKEGGYIYVCGATSMGHDVHTVLEDICHKHGSLSKTEGTAYLKKLQSSGRYVQELWA